METERAEDGSPRGVRETLRPVRVERLLVENFGEEL